MPLRMAGGSRNGNCPKSLCFAFRSLRRLWKNTGAGGLFYTSRAMLAGYVAKKTEARIAEAGHTIRKIRTRPVRRRVKKPEGVAVELADCMIRILDYCGHAGIDIEEAIRIKHEYNKTRPYRHGGKKC